MGKIEKNFALIFIFNASLTLLIPYLPFDSFYDSIIFTEQTSVQLSAIYCNCITSIESKNFINILEFIELINQESSELESHYSHSH